MTLFHDVERMTWYGSDVDDGFIRWFYKNTDGVGFDAYFRAGDGDEVSKVVYDAEGDELCVCPSVEHAISLARILNKAADERWWP